MNRAALVVVAAAAVAAPARADDGDYTMGTMGPRAVYIDVAHYHSNYDAEGVATVGVPPTEDELTEIKERRLELLQAGAEARGHCEVMWAEAGDDAARRIAIAEWMRKVFGGLHASRIELIKTVEAQFPAEVATQHVADALMLLRDLHLDQLDVLGELDTTTELAGAASPCEAREVSDSQRADQSYYAAAAERPLVENFPDDPRRHDALADLVELYADLDWRDALSWALRELLCPGAVDEYDLGMYGGIYGGPTVDYKACTPSPELEGAELVSAWLTLADQEHTVPGRRTAEIAARERAASVPGVEPQLGVMWELSQAYLAAGMRVEAVPVLDELAQAAYADSTQVDLGDQAVAKTGETLALLWRESSLPTADAALKLAQIYFHQGRRKQPHVRATFAALARTLRDLGAYEQAASVQRDLVTSWPLHPLAPATAAELIEIELERGDREAADVARGELVESFKAGTKWADANGAETAAVLVDDTMMALARSRFAWVVQLAEAKPGEVDYELHRVREILEQLVATSMSMSHVVESQFLLGSIQMLQPQEGAAAAASFAAVVDALPADAPLRDAAIGKLVRAREVALEQATDAGTVTLPAVPTDLGEVGAQPVEMPDVVAALRTSYELLLSTLDRDDDIAASLLSAAELDLRYARLDDAERGLRLIVADHCFTGSARKARDTLVDLVRARDGATAADAISKDVAARGCLDTAKALAARDKDLQKQLDRASLLIGKGELLTAARLLDKEYAQTPSTSALFDDVLLEAAQAWIGAGDEAAAARLLDDLDVRPELASSPLLLDLQITRASLARRRLDWPAAARGFLAAATTAAAKTKTKKQGAVDLASRELSSLVAAAEMLAADHVWVDRGADPGAITLYLKVARKAREVGVANAAWMRAAELAQRAGRREQLAAIHTEWRKAKLDRGHGLILEHMEGAAAEAAGDRKGADTHYREVVAKGWTADNLGVEATDAVTAAKFWLAEEALRTDTVFKAFRWGKDQADDQKRLEAIAKRIEELSAPFAACGERSSRWRIAAAVRSADVLLAAIEAFVSTPPAEWLLQMMKDRGADAGTTSHAEGMRLLLENEYRNMAYMLTEALDQPRVSGDAKWARLAEQRLAEIGSFVDVRAGVRTEVLVEEVRP